MNIVTNAETNGQPTLDAITDAASNPFDPARLRLGQDFAASVGVKKVLTTLPCRKPNRQEFVRVRSGEDWRLETGLFEDKINRDVYLVERSLWPELANEVYPACLFVAVTRQGNLFLWPCKLPGIDGRSNTWNESALSAAKLAENQWIRVSANMAAGMYDVSAALENLAEPEWSAELSFMDLLRLCFRDRFINTIDHPVLRALRGEA